jgi:hypothetical protein
MEPHIPGKVREKKMSSEVYVSMTFQAIFGAVRMGRIRSKAAESNFT